jgi:integrase
MKATKTTLKPRECNDPTRPGVTHVVEHKEGNKRRRKFFRSLEDAKAYCKGINQKRRQLGYDDAALLSAEAAREAVECIKKLATIGATLEEATEHFMKWQAAAKVSKPARDAVYEWLEEVERLHGKGELKARTVGHYQRIKKFAEHFQDQPLATITKKDLEAWLESIDGAALTRQHYRSVASVFYTWAVGKDLAQKNVALTVPKKKIKNTGGAPIKAAALQLAFDIATGHKGGYPFTSEEQQRLVAWLTLGGFGGLRSSEVMRTRWEHLNFAEGVIEVPETKSNQPRRVPMNDAAKAWLSTVAKTEGAIFNDPKYETQGELIRLREAMAKEGVKWPPNGLRKCYATCYLLLVAKGDKRATCNVTGHSNPGTLDGFYIGKFDKKDAEAVWAIRPRTGRGKIVKFA